MAHAGEGVPQPGDEKQTRRPTIIRSPLRSSGPQFGDTPPAADHALSRAPYSPPCLAGQPVRRLTPQSNHRPTRTAAPRLLRSGWRRCATHLPAPACTRHDTPALRSQSSPPPRWDAPADRVRAEPPTALSRTPLALAHVQVSKSRDRQRLRPRPDQTRPSSGPTATIMGTDTTIPADGPGPPSRPKKNPAEAGSFACST